MKISRMQDIRYRMQDFVVSSVERRRMHVKTFINYIMYHASFYLYDEGGSDMKNVEREDGIALIIALIMLLTMTMLAISISLTSNIDFQTMSNYKQGQEAFLAAERCVEEAKTQFETVGIVPLFLLLQGEVATGIQVDLPNGARCRTGPRDYDVSDGPIPFPEIPPPTKAM